MSEPGEERAGAGPATWVLLALIVLAGAWPRFQELDFGLPFTGSRPDERTLIEGSERVLAGDHEPLTLHYPPLYTYVIAGARLADRALGLAPSYDPELHTLGKSHFERARAILVGRWLTALCGTFAILATYALAVGITTRRAAVVGCALFAASHLAVRDSHFAVTDTALSLCTTLALVAALGCLRTPTRGRALLAGAAVGLAAAMKYPGALCALPVGLALLFARGRDLRRRLAGVGLAAGASILAFALLCPFVVLAPDQLFGDAWIEMTHKTAAGAVPLARRGWPAHLRLSLGAGLGWPVCWAALAGSVLLLLRPGGAGRLACVFALLWFGVMGSGTTVFARYMLPLVPLVCIFAGVAVEGAVRRLPARAHGVALCGAVLLLVALPVQRIAACLRVMAPEDTRVIAARDLRGLVKRDDRALVLGKYTQPSRHLLSRARFPEPLPRQVEALRERLERGDPNPLPGYDFVVFGDYYFEGLVRDPDPELRALLRAAFPHVATVSPLAEGLEQADLAPTFNAYDKLYLPLAGFEGVERMGPFLHIHRVPR